jgi:hypothetical protein
MQYSIDHASMADHTRHHKTKIPLITQRDLSLRESGLLHQQLGDLAVLLRDRVIGEAQNKHAGACQCHHLI